MKAIAVTVGIGVLLFGTSLFTRDRPDTRWRNGGLSPMSQEAQRPAHSRASTIPTSALPDPPVTGSLSITPPVRAEVLPPSRHKLKGRLEAAANRQTHLEAYGRQKGPRNEVVISPRCRRHRNLFATQSSSALQTGEATEANLGV